MANFVGGWPELKRRIQLTGIRGSWSMRQNSQGDEHVFTGDDGSTVCWRFGREPQFGEDSIANNRLKHAFWAADRDIQQQHDRIKSQRANRGMPCLRR